MRKDLGWCFDTFQDKAGKVSYRWIYWIFRADGEFSAFAVAPYGAPRPTLPPEGR